MLPTIADERARAQGPTRTTTQQTTQTSRTNQTRQTARTRPAVRPPSVRRPYYRPGPEPRDVRSRLTRSQGGQAWAPADAASPAATVPCWRDPEAWLAELEAALRTEAGEAARKAAHVRVETALDVAAADARAADVRTGRGLATAHATVAAVLGCSAKTVQRARDLIAALGYAVTAAVGRYLTGEERAEANAVHGGDQRRMASQRALTVPRPSQDVHLPRRGAVNPSSPPRSGLPKRAPARPGAAPRPAAKRRTALRSSQPRPTLAVQRLAGKIAARLPWLAKGHIGSLCRTLACLGLDEDGWTATDVLDLLDRRNVGAGLYALPPSSQRDPLALFAYQARAALAEVDEPPKARRERQRAALRAEQARWRAEQDAAEARWRAEQDDPDAQARIAAAKASIRATLNSARRRRRREW